MTSSEDTPVKKSKIVVSEEDEEDSIYRAYSVVSYFFVLIVIGLPVWWYTTRVYRAYLPLDEMFNAKIEAEPNNKELGLPLSINYDILITIVNPHPESLNVDIHGEDIDVSLQPFLKNISAIAEFTVKSQWMYILDFGITPKLIENEYVFYEDQLPHIITPLEKKLWSHLSPNPCINLVLHISNCETPLRIYTKQNVKLDSNAFLSPRWGGIYFLNADNASCERQYFKPNLKLVLATFINQLSNMFNVTSYDESSVNYLKMVKAKEMISSSRRTLKSLAQLLSEISSIVISDDVAKKFNTAVESADIAQAYLGKNEIDRALHYAKIAFNNAETAFSDPSLLALLYFPDDQKYAVYIPLFLPVMIPVLMSIAMIKKKLKQAEPKLKIN